MMIKEPNFKEVTMNLAGALNFYSTHFSFSDSKKWALEWLYDNDPEQAQRLQGVKEHTFSNRGYLCRMISRGYPLDKSIVDDKILKFFRNIQIDSIPVQEKIVPKKKTEKADPEQTNSIIFQLEDVVDAILSQKDIPDVMIPVDASQLKIAKSWIEKELVEAQEALRQQELIIQNLQSVYERCGGVIEAVKKEKIAQKTQKTQINKPSSNTAVLKNLRYSKGDEASEVKSISPLKIIGAKKLLTYNTETRIATLYVALDKNGLTVSGSSIKGFDEEKSYSQKIRKPELFLSGSDYMASLKEQKTTQGKARGLTSVHTVLLSVK